MDPAAALGLLSPLAGVLALAVLHVLISRAAPALSRPRALGGSVLAGLAVVAALAAADAGRGGASASAVNLWGAAAVWILTYLSLAYCYVFGFYNPGESARRIRLLVELRAAGDRGLTLDEILAAYNARMIVEARLRRLLTGRQILEHGGRYFSKPSAMLYIAKVVDLLTTLLYGGGGRAVA